MRVCKKELLMMAMMPMMDRMEVMARICSEWFGRRCLLAYLAREPRRLSIFVNC